MRLLKRAIPPVPRGVTPRVICSPVYCRGGHAGVVPWQPLFVRIRVVVESGGKVDEVCPFISYHFKAVPVVAGYPYYLWDVPCCDDLGELFRLIVVGAEL